MLTIIITGTIITALAARLSSLWPGLSFQNGLLSCRAEGWILEPVIEQPVKEQSDSLGIDSTSHFRSSTSSLLSVNSQD